MLMTLVIFRELATTIQEKGNRMHPLNTLPKKLELVMPSFVGGQVRLRKTEKDGFIYERRGEFKSCIIDEKNYKIRFRLKYWCVRGVTFDKYSNQRTIWTPIEIPPDFILEVRFGPLGLKLKHYYYLERERLVGTPTKPARKKRIKIHSSSVEIVHVFMKYDPTNITETEEGEFLPCPDHLESKEDPD